MNNGESEEERRPEKGRQAESERPSGQAPGDDPESARRAFDVLERFTGELEAILLSLERAKTRADAIQSGDPAALEEPPYRPTSIRFDASPISTRIDSAAMPPIPAPPPPARTGLRLTFEAFFLIVIAAISARTGLRPLLIAGAEALAFLIVASVELAIARDRQPSGDRLLPAPPPSPLAPAEFVSTTRRAPTALDEIEPLVWPAEAREAASAEAERLAAGPTAEPEPEPEWPISVSTPAPSEEESEVPPLSEEVAEDLDSTIEVPASRDTVEPALPIPEPPDRFEVTAEEEARSDEPEAKAHRRRLRRRHKAREEPSVIEPAAEPEPAIEIEPEPEVEAELEVGAEAKEHRRRLRRRHEAREEPSDIEPEAEPEPAIEIEPEPEPEAEAEPDAGGEPETEVVARERRHWLRHRHEEEPEEIEPEVEAEIEREPEVEAEAKERRRRLRRRHEAGEETSEVEPEPETEDEPESKEHLHWLRRRHGEEPGAIEPVAEVEAEMEEEAEAALTPEAGAKGHRHRLRHRHDEEPEKIEPEPEAQAEIEPAAEVKGHLHWLRGYDETGEEAGDTEPAQQTEAAEELLAEQRPDEPERRRRSPRARRKAAAETEIGGEDELEIPAIREKRRFRRSRAAPEPELSIASEPSAEVREAEPESGAEASGETTVEIDLPQDVAVSAIEQTLDELGSQKARERRRRWPFSPNGEKTEAKPASAEDELDETLRLEQELRLSAEQERRRREREYQRGLRAPLK